MAWSCDSTSTLFLIYSKFLNCVLRDCYLMFSCCDNISTSIFMASAAFAVVGAVSWWATYFGFEIKLGRLKLWVETYLWTMSLLFVLVGDVAAMGDTYRHVFSWDTPCRDFIENLRLLVS